MKMKIQLLSVLALMIVMGTGCAAFSRHRVPEVPLFTAPSQSRSVDASYQFTAGIHMSPGARGDFSGAAKQIWEQEFLTTLRTSGYFANVQPGQGGAIHFEADMENYSNSMYAAGAGVISGLSLLTIPAWATDGYRLKATVTTARGTQKQYVLDDAMATVFWLPLIAVLPFHNTINTSEEVRTNLYRTLIVQMQQDGILPAR